MKWNVKGTKMTIFGPETDTVAIRDLESRVFTLFGFVGENLSVNSRYYLIVYGSSEKISLNTIEYS